MTKKNIIAPHNQVQTSQGQPLAGGFITLKEPGTSTDIVSYKDSGLVTPHGLVSRTVGGSPQNVIILSSSGRQNIWVNRDCDMRIYDRNGNFITEELNANPDATDESTSGLIPNGSFETDSDSDGVPDSWDLVNETGSSNALDTSTQTDGVQSYRFTSTGSGGGSLTTSDFFVVNDVDDLTVSFDIVSSVADVRNIVRVEWYDATQVSISDTDIYDDSATNPLTFTRESISTSPPSGARFAKLKLIGCDPSDTTPGSTFFDRINVTYLDVGTFDSISISGTTISSTAEMNLTATDEINMTPGVGDYVAIGNAGDGLNPVNIQNSVTFGRADPENNTHVGIGEDAIQARDDASTMADLNLNPFGGDVYIGAQSGTGTVRLHDDGDIIVEIGQEGLIVRGSSAANPEFNLDQDTKIDLTNASGQDVAQFGFYTSQVLKIGSKLHEGHVAITGENGSGTEVNFLLGDPNAETSLYASGAETLQLSRNFIDVIGDDNSASTVKGFRIKDASFNLIGELSTVNSTVSLKNVQEEDIISGGITTTTLFHNGTEVVETLTAANGGLQVDNQQTGSGLERVLTTSDRVRSGLSKRKTASTSRNTTTTFTDDPHLALFSLDLSEASVYTFKGVIAFFSSSATPNAKMQLQFSGSGARDREVITFHQIGSGATVDKADSALDAVTVFTAPLNGSSDGMIVIEGMVDFTATTGTATVDLQWAQSVSDATDTTLREGSYLRFEPML